MGKKKNVLFLSLVLGGFVLILGLLAIFFILAGGKPDSTRPLLYLKGNQIRLLPGSGADPCTLIDNITNQNALVASVSSTDGQMVLFSDEYDLPGDPFRLFWRKTAGRAPAGQPAGEGGKLLSASAFDYFAFAGNDSCAIYRENGQNGVGTLCLHDFEQAVVIDRDVWNFYLSADKKQVYYLKDAGSRKYDLYRFTIGSGRSCALVASGITSFQTRGADDLYYLQDGSLYLSRDGAAGQKLFADAGQYFITASGAVYFTRSSSKTLSYTQFVNDPLLESDKNIVKPETADFQAATLTDEYGTFTTIDYSKFKTAINRYNGKYLREQIRSILSKAELTLSTCDLLCYTGGEPVLVDPDVGGLYYCAGADALVYRKYSAKAAKKVEITEIELTAELVSLPGRIAEQAELRVIFGTGQPETVYTGSQLIGSELTADGKYFSVIKKEGTAGRSVDVYPVQDGRLGKRIITGRNIVRLESAGSTAACLIASSAAGSELSTFELNILENSQLSFVAGKTTFCHLTADGRLYYASDAVSAKNGQDYQVFGSLYLYDGARKVKIAGDVHGFMPLGDGTAVCLTDYDFTRETGDLLQCRNGRDPVKLDEKVRKTFGLISMLGETPMTGSLPAPLEESSPDPGQRLNGTTNISALITGQTGPGYMKFPAGADYSAEIPTVPSDAGNTQGNLGNWGFVCQQGDWIYYGSNALYKVKADGSGKTRLGPVSFYLLHHINVADGWIYFGYYQNTETQKLARIKTDGTGFQVLCTAENIGKICVVGGKVYFAAGDSSKMNYLYRMDPDGQNVIRLLEKPVGYGFYFLVQGGYIYTDVTDSDFSTLDIYRLNTDGSEAAGLNLTSTAGDGLVGFNNGRLIYLNNGIYLTCDTDGRNIMDLGVTVKGYKLLLTGATAYYVRDGAIYRSRAGLDLEEKVISNPTGYELIDFNLTRDWIYFQVWIEDRNSYFGGFYGICRVRKDGSGFEKVYG